MLETQGGLKHGPRNEAHKYQTYKVQLQIDDKSSAKAKAPRKLDINWLLQCAISPLAALDKRMQRRTNNKDKCCPTRG